jgi:hypothetical protein
MDTNPSLTPERPFPYYDAHVAAWRSEQEKARVAAHMEASMRGHKLDLPPAASLVDQNAVDQKFSAFVDALDRAETKLSSEEFETLLVRIERHASARLYGPLDPGWKVASR